MTNFSKFDRTNLKNLRADLDALLNKYGVDVNVDFEVGGMKFSEAEVEIKLKAKVRGAKTRSDSTLETYMKLLNLSARNIYGDELVSYNSRAYKMPFVYKGRDGKLYKCSADRAKMMFGR